MRQRQKYRVLLCLGSLVPTSTILALHGCRDATQVTLEVKTNVACNELRGVEIVVATEPTSAEERAALSKVGTRFPAAITTTCEPGTPNNNVGTLVLTPSGTEGAVVVIAAFGKARTSDCQAPNFAPECIVSRRRFTFVEHTPVRLPIVLDPVCAGIPCTATSTCVGKKCVDSRVECQSGSCTNPGIGTDGGVVEVDGSSPLLDGGEPAADTAATDGPSPPIDGGNDTGPPIDAGPRIGVCPTPNFCRDTNNTVCGANQQQQINRECCFPDDAGNVAACSPVGLCQEHSVCCRDSTDCAPGDVCCASTNSNTPNTSFSCTSEATCTLARTVCRVVGDSGCGTTHGTCNAVMFSQKPDFFSCS